MEVYKITNLINSKIYVGMTTKSYLKRFRVHVKNSEKLNYALYKAMRKYDVKNFSVELIEVCESIEELIKKEAYWIRTLDSMNPKIGYNMINQEDWGKIFSEETKKKISESQKKNIEKMSKEAKESIYMKASISRQKHLRNKGNSNYIGVCLQRNGRFNCQTSYLKTQFRRIFLTEIEAAEAYDKLVLYLYGENANINFENKRNEYLESDLCLFIDWFLNDRRKQGRPAKYLYPYYDLIPESRLNAKNNIEKYNIKNIDVFDLTFYYDGEISNDFLLKYSE